MELPGLEGLELHDASLLAALQMPSLLSRLFSMRAFCAGEASRVFTDRCSNGNQGLRDKAAMQQLAIGTTGMVCAKVFLLPLRRAVWSSSFQEHPGIF